MMDARTREIAEECTAASDAERISFGEVVMKLMQAGFERYHTDLTRDQKTYYLPDGQSYVVPNAAVEGPKAARFSPESVDAAVRAIQRNEIQYREFCTRIAAAGCVGYFVSLAGRRAVYYGRTGETHVEHFPAAK
jgi:uncharacterized protein YbcV (DUF1398 family)